MFPVGPGKRRRTNGSPWRSQCSSLPITLRTPRNGTKALLSAGDFRLRLKTLFLTQNHIFLIQNRVLNFKTQARPLRFIPNSAPQGVFESMLRTTGLSDLVFRKHKLSIRLWLLKANPGLRPRSRFLFFFFSSYFLYSFSHFQVVFSSWAIVLQLFSSLFFGVFETKGISHVFSRCSALRMTPISPPEHSIPSPRCAVAWAEALKPYHSCTCLCCRLPRWPLEYFHLFTIQSFYHFYSFYPTLVSNLHLRLLPCILMHNAFLGCSSRYYVKYGCTVRMANHFLIHNPGTSGMNTIFLDFL